MTSAYAEVIGDPIAQSKSPAIHNFWLGKLGIDAEYRKQQVNAGEVGEYLASRRADPNWLGCNVTMPHKQAVMAFCDEIEEPAATIGAVNTVIASGGGRLVGTNTDAAGFLEPISSRLAEKHFFRMARILGTGGAARAIVVALAAQGFTIVLAGRNQEKARGLLEELAPAGEHHAADLAHFAQPTDFAFDDRQGCLDLVVNASPLGMAGQPPLLLDLSHIPPGSIIYDIVTHPLETPLLAKARGAGFETIDGYNMLIGQAAFAFERFFGHAPPRDNNDAELRGILSQ